MKTIVDLLGAFLPGLVWATLFLTAAALPSSDPAATLGAVLHGPVSEQIAFLLGGLLCGLGLKGLVMKAAEPLARPDAVMRWFGQRHGGAPLGDFLFPFNHAHGRQPYFAQLKAALEREFGSDPAALPSFQPFSACKRMLKAKHPALAEELDTADSEARMLASLFMASLFSLCEAAVALAPGWIAASAAGAVVFGLGFRLRRSREAAYCYLNFLVAMGPAEQATRTASYNHM